ncbi:BZ3500_MvSof-1268-A1-R1_Chr7-2g09480 [Microbotryum saponariae]|uniref:BZ3500_MvSof-1268-A1-R1_Chr7-2g09480 protein n=1 Tax=Microbotryum saponariae TaxID=289078 RepID=A0A2X0LBT7_9BASI|nr:BZ3501_MvSof-1269-A2-R1_Chr7-1g09180 [Microbotryum saponariae]SDA02530.1 BZ3500_MvSof-1268-A1-R1_Chr7-2g09480 [Microbotryum saponariae]
MVANVPSPSSSITRGDTGSKEDVEKHSEEGNHQDDLAHKPTFGDLEKQQTNATQASAILKEKPKLQRDKLKFIPFLGRVQPRDPYPSLDDAADWPKPSLLSIWTFHWIQPLLIVGYQRTLVATDLWKLPPSMECGPLADQLMEHFERRRKEVEAWNQSLDDGSFKPSILRRGWWKMRASIGLGAADGRRKPGLALALSDTFKYQFWSAGVIKVVADTAQVTSPLVTKALIQFSTKAYNHAKGVPGYEPQSVGYGVALAIIVWLMQVIASLGSHQFFARSASTGVLARSTLIASIYRRSTTLSGKARTVMTNGRLVNHVGTDVSRIDFAAGFFHMSWTAPIQMIIIVVILLVNLGPSSLAGIFFLFLSIPPQGWAMKKMLAARKRAMVWTDKRAKLIQELLGGQRIIKFFSWQQPYLRKLREIRESEMFHVRNLLAIRSATSAVAMSMPAIATVVAFLVYSGTGHSQNSAIIFTSLTLFNLLRMPLMMLPVSLATMTDAHNALGRITEVFLAESRSGTYQFDAASEFAIQVDDADFQWEGAPPEEATAGSKKEQQALVHKLKQEQKKAKHDKKGEKKKLPAPEQVIVDEKKPGVALDLADKTPADGADAVDTDVSRGVPAPAEPTPDESQGESPADKEKDLMQLSHISLRIPKGQLCAIVGPVGAGKSSLLQALVGEMKRTRGSVTFNGSLAYAPQVAWMQSVSLRDNVLFGQPYDQARYERAITNACLDADIEMLPFGDATEIGEKGVTLSGGQKQRVNIARALYYDADIVLLDDPLSAVDAHVGKALFDDAICGALKDRTRVLVTHAVHFLPRVDWIVTIDQGRIQQEGTYADLIADKDGPFSKMIAEFGGDATEKREEEEEVEEDAIEAAGDELVDAPKKSKKKGKGLMQEEERATGAVDGGVYMAFLRAAKGHVTVPLLILSLALAQGAQVLGSYWLVWWQENHFHTQNGFYMGIYALLGILQAVFSFLMGLASVFIGYNASRSLHRGAIQGVMHAPMSFFDTTPLGRIMNRFSKDIDTIDNTLNDSMRMALNTFGSVLGAIILISIVQPYFLIVVTFILCCYFYAASFYRTSAREIKRLGKCITRLGIHRWHADLPRLRSSDNLLRSSLYAHFSETLSGLATIRAFGETDNFLKRNEEYIDIENRAYALTVINQRWLGFRLDMFGGLLVFIVAIFGVATRTKVSPAQTGLILSYILSIQAAFSWMVRQLAEVENDMNSVERILHYANNLEQEAPSDIEETRPDPSWPAHGAIEFENVFMSYRPELPPVLKGLSLRIEGGQKIGVVGRTGAGKSTILQCLFRMVELQSGKISIDGIDISKLGLNQLREKIAIIPQDALLFSGTLRSNLDPFNVYEDSVLWDAMRRAYLVDQVPAGEVASATATTTTATATATATAATGDETAVTAATTATSRFTLDMVIEDEGLNLSVGQRSLVSLARALVKDSRVIVLDEATASVDLATDSHIQQTIRSEFNDKTLLIIAHRLRTIIDCDRVLVMSEGQVAEYDTPINLFRNKDGIFSSMCSRSNISEADILRKAAF